jgi:predicted RNase H-like HicB family nuclease/DNA-binding XRE family transcriptional regulator
MKYHFKVYKESKGYWTKCIEIDGCQTQADTLMELRENAAEALNLHLSEPPDSNLIFPPPKVGIRGKNIFEVEVEPSIAIANRIRQLRVENELTQNAMKDRLGIKNLSNYQRLEDPSRANPAWTTLLMIKKAFPDFHVDDLMS